MSAAHTGWAMNHARRSWLPTLTSVSATGGARVSEEVGNLIGDAFEVGSDTERERRLQLPLIGRHPTPESDFTLDQTLPIVATGERKLTFEALVGEFALPGFESGGEVPNEVRQSGAVVLDNRGSRRCS